jgi:hydrogenase maturation factor
VTPAREPAHAGHCITCGDEGIAMRIVGLAGEGATCVDDEAAVHHDVAVELVGAVAVGDRILVHAGVAIGRIEERG